MNRLNWPKYDLHLLLCVNNRPKEVEKPSCGNNMNFNFEDFKELKMWLMTKELNKKVKLTRTYCLGICPKEGFIVLIYPKQEYYLINDLKELKELILKEVN